MVAIHFNAHVEPLKELKTMKALRLFGMAALALVMAACAKEVDAPIEPEQQSLLQQGEIHFRATLKAPNSGSDTKTVYTEDGNTIFVAWKVDDEIALIHNGVKDVATVTAVDASGNATIEATITGSPSDGSSVLLAYPADAVESTGSGIGYTPEASCWEKVHAQDGTLDYIQNNIDFRMGGGQLAVSGDPATASLKADVSLTSIVSIWKLTLQDDETNAIAATKVKFFVNSTQVAAATSTAKSVYYFALVPAYMVPPYVASGDGDLTIEATAGPYTYSYTKAGGVSLYAGKYYRSTVTMTDAILNLSLVTTDCTVKNGVTIIGTLGGKHKISIADGATVVLKDATISYSSNGADYAGLTLLGDGTLVLADGTTNTVVGGLDGSGYSNWPGIYVPVGKTLTINGNTGVLNARRGGNDTDDGSPAGIGASWANSCGNIVINGGVINAIGGAKGAGIGGTFFRSCGDITINGGTITATGNKSASGIGLGGPVGNKTITNVSCGNITITGGTVNATGGWGSAGIGTGFVWHSKSGTVSLTCGNILISGGTVTATGGAGAAGIGTGGVKGGSTNNCGNITITDGVTSVTVTKGLGNHDSQYNYDIPAAPNSIGKGSGNGTCGSVTIGGTVYWDGSAYQNGGDTYLTNSPLIYPAP